MNTAFPAHEESGALLRMYRDVPVTTKEYSYELVCSFKELYVQEISVLVRDDEKKILAL